MAQRSHFKSPQRRSSPESRIKETPIQEIKVVVAAIDFGTTYSGYAYSLYSDYKRDPLKIYANQAWSANGEGLVTMKTPTIALFDRKGQFHSFGFEAEKKYIDLATNEEHIGWKYFRRFKMKLNERINLRKDMTLFDDQKKPKLAKEVFAASIKYLKDHLLKRIQMSVHSIVERDIFWVLTVPAIWHDGARQFMVESARLAGIPESKLTLALEPECAAIFCKEEEMNRSRTTLSNGDLSSFDPGSQFMVVDLGGGTIDITVHEVDKDGNLTELMVPSGGPWGGTCVDRAFDVLLKDLFTAAVVLAFGKQYTEDELDLQRAIEIKKRSFNQESETFALRLPSSIFYLFKENTECDFQASLNAKPFSGSVRKKGDKVIIEHNIIRELFKEPKDRVIEHLKKLLSQPGMEKVSTLLLVGGFAESDVMNEAIKTAFMRKRVTIPHEAGLAVVKGAVMYGHNMDSISARKMPFSIGISTAVPFDDKIHPHDKKVYSNRSDKCEDVFKIFARKNQTVVRNKTSVEHEFNWPHGIGEAKIEIYRSSNTEPRYVTDEDCKSVGYIELDLGMTSGTVSVILVQMSFGDTLIHAKAHSLTLSTHFIHLCRRLGLLLIT